MNTARSPKPCYRESDLVGAPQKSRPRVSGLGGRVRPLARPSRKNFSENLSLLLAKIGLNNVEFARELKVSNVTVGRWLKGGQEPSFEDKDAIVAVAKRLGHKTTVARLFSDPTEPASLVVDVEQAIKNAVQAAIENGLKS